MKDVIIHIGMPRTGTTFLQREVFPRLGINYIDGSNIRNSTIPISYNVRKIIRDIAKGKRREEIKQYITDGINLISYEGLCGNVFSKDYHDFYRNMLTIHIMFPDAKIIFIIRRFEEITTSLYNLYIKTGGILTFEEFAERYISLKRFFYNDKIKYLNSLFNEVYVDDFKNLKKDADGFVKGICDFIGVPAPKFENKRHNAAIKHIDAMILVNRFFRTKWNEKGIIPWRYLQKRFPSLYPPRILFERVIK